MVQPAGQSAYFSKPGLLAPASGQVGQEKPQLLIAEISLSIGGWQAGTPCQEGLEDDAHSRTSQPHSLALASRIPAGAEMNAIAATLVMIKRMSLPPEHAYFTGRSEPVVSAHQSTAERPRAFVPPAD